MSSHTFPPGPRAGRAADERDPVTGYATIEEFFDARPERRGSPQADYGTGWTENGQERPPWRVSWLEETGEVFAVRLADSPAGPVRLLAIVRPDPVLPGRRKPNRTLDALLDGWADHAVSGGDLAWVTWRLSLARDMTVVRTRSGWAVSGDGSMSCYLREDRTKTAAADWITAAAHTRVDVAEHGRAQERARAELLASRRIGEIDWRQLRPGDLFTWKAEEPPHRVTRAQHFDNGASLIEFEPGSHTRPCEAQILMTPPHSAYGRLIRDS